MACTDCHNKQRAKPSTLGWRVWYEDGSIFDSRKTAWADLPDDGLYIKMIYCADGKKQVQTADWYFVAPHVSGENIHGTCADRFYEESIKRYEGAVFKRGKWAPEDYFKKIREDAMGSSW